MQLRRFTGKSAPEALAAVRRDLGGDAIILANRPVDGQVEIIATRTLDSLDASTRELPEQPPVRAVNFERIEAPTNDASTNNSSTTDASSNSARTSDSPTQPDFSAALATRAREYQQAQRWHAEAEADTEDQERAQGTPEHRLDDAPDTVELVSQAPAQDYEPVTLMREPAPAATTTPTTPSSASEDVAIRTVQHPATAPVDTDGIAAAVAAQVQTQQQPLIDGIGDVLDRINALQTSLWGQVAPVRSRMVKALLRLGAGAELAIRTAERIDDAASDDAAYRQCLDILKCSIPVARDTSTAQPGVTLVSGGPGEERAVVIGKIATERLQKDAAASMVIIAMESERIGAMELLQTYGKLLGIPVVLARSAGELDSLLEAFGHKDLIFVDHEVLPGIEQANNPGDLEAFSSAHPDTEIRHLIVLPATAQPAHVDALITQCNRPGTSRCVIAALEQSCRLAELFTPIIRHHLPVAYWSDNSQLQTALTRADASVLVATAVAMSRRLASHSDDELLYRMVQPASAGMASVPSQLTQGE